MNIIILKTYMYIYIHVHGTPLQYSCLENPMDGGAWWAAVRGVARSRTRLSDFTLNFHFHALEEEMKDFVFKNSSLNCKLIFVLSQ